MTTHPTYVCRRSTGCNGGAPDRLHTRTAPAETATRFHHAVFGLDLRFQTRADGDGTFEGYGSVHNVTDSYGTTMLPGCWRNGGLDSQPYALLWMHDPTVVLGTFRATEDDRGLWIEGRYDETDVGQRARQQARSGSAPGLSVGFVVVSALEEDPNQFNAVRLVEVSQITARMAATPGAELASVRQAEQATEEVRRARKAAVARARLIITD